MNINEIKNLDCSIKQNRIVLGKEIAALLKISKLPSREVLEKYCERIGNKTTIRVQHIVCESNYFLMSVNTGDSQYFSVFKCYSYYEALCKYILYVNARLKYNKRKR